MTQIEQTPDTDEPLDPSDLLLALIIALLAPMFLGVSAGNVPLARMAAIQAVAAYRTRTNADLIAVAQIVAFGLAALGSLSLSLADDLSLSLTLRLRGNANALNRSAEQNRRALANNLTNDLRSHQPEPVPDLDTFLNLATASALDRQSPARLRPTEAAPVSTPPSPTAPPTNERNQQMWAIALVKEGEGINASIPNLPPDQREAASIRVAILGHTANHLLHGTPLPRL